MCVYIVQDGSCNGLQHYAALARDMSGAKAVNVYPADKPQDVYQAVATRVDARVRRDAAANDSIAVKLIEREGGVDRKLVKQTVMTTVYGVTFIGAKDQIASRLRERGWKNETEIGKVRRVCVCVLVCVGVCVIVCSRQTKACLRPSSAHAHVLPISLSCGSPLTSPHIHTHIHTFAYVFACRAAGGRLPSKTHSSLCGRCVCQR